MSASASDTSVVVPFIPVPAVCVGADPEFFVKRGETFVSAHNFPCGTKHAPRRTPNGAVQVDGVALEVNVEPAFSEEGFILNYRKILGDLDTIVRAWDHEAYLVPEPVAFFTQEYMDRLPPNAKALGCEPDYNAYTACANETPNGGALFRTGAGHLHVGWTKEAEGLEHFEKCCTLVKTLDYTVGLRTLLFDGDSRRRLLYGRAGAFRPKHYGLEYRVPSNAWCAEENLARAMFRGVKLGVELLNAGRDLDKETAGLAQMIINSNDREWPNRYPKLAELIIGE